MQFVEGRIIHSIRCNYLGEPECSTLLITWPDSEHKPEAVPSIPPDHYTSQTVMLLGAVLSLKWPLSKWFLHHNSVFRAAYLAHYYLL